MTFLKLIFAGIMFVVLLSVGSFIVMPIVSLIISIVFAIMPFVITVVVILFFVGIIVAMFDK